jgi:hypothetical protein
MIGIAFLLVDPAALSRPGSRILACGAGATTMQVKGAQIDRPGGRCGAETPAHAVHECRALRARIPTSQKRMQ